MDVNGFPAISSIKIHPKTYKLLSHQRIIKGKLDFKASFPNVLKFVFFSVNWSCRKTNCKNAFITSEAAVL